MGGGDTYYVFPSNNGRNPGAVRVMEKTLKRAKGEGD